jgi:pyridoxamine 5'-phosphate oxidase
MNIPAEAISRFETAMQAAQVAREPEPSAMSLATSDSDGRLSVRTILLKELDARGFVFYTHRQSNKGRQLAQHPRAALSILWKAIFRQVLVEGEVESVTDEDADAYFASRPRGSQICAWASAQSEALESRELLEQRVKEFEAKFMGEDVPRPPHWSGYRLVPDMIEFWYGKESRLHDRFRFTLNDGEWQKQRLYP